MKIVSIGDFVTDYYYKDDKLLGVNGGMTSHNIIANLAVLKLPTKVFGVCGNDINGEISIKSLEDLNVDITDVLKLDNINTRCFHISYKENNGKLEFTSKKRCPICNNKKWYDKSEIKVDYIVSKIDSEDILVFDNLNSKNRELINLLDNKKMLDLGQYYELDNYENKDIIEYISSKFEIINLNERVEKYLLKRFNISSLNEIFQLFKSKLVIVTRGKKGADFVIENKIITKKLIRVSDEIDSTGAGDAFFSSFINDYCLNNYIINEEYVDFSFEKATKLTSKVVKKMGARGHINNLYKIKKSEECSCNNYILHTGKQIKRCNININNLEKRVLNALQSSAFNNVNKIDFSIIDTSLFIGTGGSLAGANFSSKVINELYGTNTYTILPREVKYRNNRKVDNVFLFSYSGITNDVIESVSEIDNDKKYIITKGETQKIIDKTRISKNNIFSYRTTNNKGKERGFLSFEGSLAPSSLFLKKYMLENKYEKTCEEFIKERIKYWNLYFLEYFKINKKMLKKILTPKNLIYIFTGDYTTSAGIDLESKIIESGIFNCIIHEKKNFSHGRFINYEHLNDEISVYFKQNKGSKYEVSMLDYLNKDKTIILESSYNGILCEYDLLIASQYLVYNISNLLNIDISKPVYKEEAMKIYFYKGGL
ncbi:MAG: PfkB family carbohydrate kinase [Bacilli bacterium]